jgi:hypothetical protein
MMFIHDQRLVIFIEHRLTDIFCNCGRLALASMIVWAMRSGDPGAATHPIFSSEITRASSDSPSATPRIGFPADMMLYIRLGTEAPAIPLTKEIIAISQALSDEQSSKRGCGGRIETFLSCDRLMLPDRS